MRLKKLILHGFKSFAERTEFVFDAPITGIVGPNGCGKSNVVDGFKWVLGEQSAKSLRGDAMADVIFNGSGNRKPGGMAEVTLVFENPPGSDGTRLLNLNVDEVSVGRRLYRDGTSEYQVNGGASRLKDVRELFLDTGVGVDAYSVIEQGRVSAILESNAQERRQIFEEAAGISKFKARKKESQRKLEKVEQNLLRVNDIVEEVEKRLRSVKLQAGKARTYGEYVERLRGLRLAYALREFGQFSSQSNEIHGQREDAQFRHDDAAGDLARSTADLTEKRQNHEALAQVRQQVEYDLLQAQASIQAARQRQHYASQQLKQISEQLESLDRDQAETVARRDELKTKLDAETVTLESLSAELLEQRGAIDALQQNYRDAQLRNGSLDQQIESAKTAVLDAMRKLASLNSRLGGIGIERKNLAGHQSRLEQRQTVIAGELAALTEADAQLKTRLDEALSQIDQHQAALANGKQQSEALGKKLASLSQQAGAARENRSGLLSRQKILQEMENRREGVSESVKSILRQREKFPFVRGLVADVLRADVEHAHVIEAALDGRDQWTVTDDSAAAYGAVDGIKQLQGRVTCLCTDKLSDDSAICDWNAFGIPLRLAIDLVRFEPSDRPLARRLLGRTVVVETPAAAAELHRKAPSGFRYVTKSGEVIEADGSLRAGPLTASMALISRRAELESLTHQIADADWKINQLTTALAEGNTSAKAVEEQLNQLRNALYAANTTKVELTSSRAQNADKQNGIKREQPIVERELANLSDQTARLDGEEANLTQQRTDLESAQAAAQSQVESLAVEQKQSVENLSKLNEQLTSGRVELGKVQEKQLAAGQNVQRMTVNVTELAQQIERIDQNRETVRQKRPTIEREQQTAAASETALVETIAARQERMSSLAEELGSSQNAMTALESRVSERQQQKTTVEQEISRLEIAAGELRVRIESLTARVQDELQLDIAAEFEKSLAPKATEPEPSTDAAAGVEPEVQAEQPESETAELQPEELEQSELEEERDWSAVAKEISELRDKIARLGNVNMEAIGEQQSLEERNAYLSAQVTDLTTSKTQLVELIDQINAESCERFRKTFEAVREHFQGMFRKLFGGGRADIYLETELDQPAALPSPNGAGDIAGVESHRGESQPPEVWASKKIDILDAGIEIIAHPPGKKPVSISQLSGGEKTMTCVALLMSIFKSKPSPFCILDEVDAALDEANNQRFNLIVQEFLEQSQFIIITHSKRSMQIADVLYGVTMQEQGVSKRVAVKFDQVGVDGKISEQAAA